MLTEALTFQRNRMCNGAERSLQEFWEKYRDLADMANPDMSIVAGRLINSTSGNVSDHLSDLKEVAKWKLGAAMFGHMLPIAYAEHIKVTIDTTLKNRTSPMRSRWTPSRGSLMI